MTTIDRTTHKGSDLLVRCLEAQEVEYIFGVPGEENLDFLESLRNSSIKLILTRHEQAAAFMAATYGRLTGRPAVALTTLGPGATNLTTGVAYAQLGGMPLVVITGQKPIKRSKQGRFQILDVVATMVPITKFAEQIPSADKIPSMVAEAFKRAEEERPGAVHLELPEDIAREESTNCLMKKVWLRRPQADPVAIDRAAQRIMEAERPLLMLAAGANRRRVSDSLQALVKKTGIPFFNTQMGKGVLDERQQTFLGTAALTEGDYLHCAIDRADLIVCVGHDVTEKPPAIMGHTGTADVIHINFYSAEVDDVYYPTLEVIGDIAGSIASLTEKLQPQSSWDFDYYHKIAKENLKRIAERSDNQDFPIKPQRFVRDLRQSMPEDAILTLDNGIYKIWVARNYMAYQRNTVLLDNALATMGAGLPSAIGAKITHPERKVVAICGDGGFMMNSQELETAVRLKLDLVVIILRDDAYGMIKWKQEAMGFADYGLDYQNPDFVAYAESYGAHGWRIEQTEQFAARLTHCLETPGVHLIDLPVDYSENQRVLTEELAHKECLI
uniref:Thiamine pyrophosphate-requiring enzymes [acetolactate synthase, pyruvate dehydrogenase (Cytochrome), glyoxylate carboligase, phosphonopyruvate decarboxylase] n=1 Tax=Magnetococcus massalia (strain MO-1) TaxID=451514 RepID=A0A1S7LIF7_MAGMO|nr:Thiamine pyrophosphate-requiring enzymes [acetolactate synthase, pyruvate dehydrogenase (cytochrome), glyoxylate carboligase, phosphonopyruvate decarboxylase] [Candidatus Magnetococcus massalia]